MADDFDPYAFLNDPSLFDLIAGLNDTNMSFTFVPPTIKSSDENEYTRDLITYYLMGIGCMTVCSIGLVCNMMSLVVLTRRSMRSSTYSYLSALAVCDSLFLLFTMVLISKDLKKPVEGEHEWAWSGGWSGGWYPYVFPYVHALAFTFQVTSIWLTLTFTVDRYIMICHPFTAEPYCTISRARKVIVVMFLCSLIFNIPKFFEYQTVVLSIPFKNETRVICDLTELGHNKYFKHLYHSGFYIAFVCGLPFVALAVLNAFLMRAVHQSRKRGREIAAADKKRNDTTIMLISVVVVFFICQMPALVSRTIWAVDEDQAILRSLSLYILNELANFMLVLNSSINIVPYYFFGKKFRREFWKVFCVCLLNYKAVTRKFSITNADHDRQYSRNQSVCSGLLQPPPLNQNLSNGGMNHHGKAKAKGGDRYLLDVSKDGHTQETALNGSYSPRNGVNL